MGSRKSGAAAGGDHAEWGEVRAIALDHLGRMARLKTKIIRAGKPGAIHDFRVSTRRLQQTIDLLLPADPRGELRDLRRSVVRGRRALSAVRDCDVSIALASAHFAVSRPASRELWRSVGEFLNQRRPQKYRRAIRKLEKLDLDRAFHRLRVLIELSTKGSRRGLREAGYSLGRNRFSRRLPEELRRLSNAYSSAIRAAASTPSTASIHKLRVAVKRLRYLVEIARRFEGDQSREPLSTLRAFQTALGDWHDRETEVRLLTKLAKRPERLRGKSSKSGNTRKALEEQRARIAAIKRRQRPALNRAQNRRLEAGLLALAQHAASLSRG